MKRLSTSRPASPLFSFPLYPSFSPLFIYHNISSSSSFSIIPLHSSQFLISFAAFSSSLLFLFSLTPFLLSFLLHATALPPLFLSLFFSHLHPSSPTFCLCTCTHHSFFAAPCFLLLPSTSLNISWFPLLLSFCLVLVLATFHISSSPPLLLSPYFLLPLLLAIP